MPWLCPPPRTTLFFEMGWRKRLICGLCEDLSWDGRVSRGQQALHVALSLKAHYSITVQKEREDLMAPLQDKIRAIGNGKERHRASGHTGSFLGTAMC